MKLDRKKAVEELSKRGNGQVTATEVMLRSSPYTYPDEQIAEHVLTFILKPLCGPYGKVMP